MSLKAEAEKNTVIDRVRVAFFLIGSIERQRCKDDEVLSVSRKRCSLLLLVFFVLLPLVDIVVVVCLFVFVVTVVVNFSDVVCFDFALTIAAAAM